MKYFMPYIDLIDTLSELDFITGHIYFEEHRATDISAVFAAVTVQGNEISAVEIAENHAMTVIGRGERFGLLNPRSCKAALGVGHAHGVDIIYP